MTLKELADRAGNIDYAVASEAIRYFDRRKRMKPDVRRAHKAVIDILGQKGLGQIGQKGRGSSFAN
jgi:hypothetical protein